MDNDFEQIHESQPHEIIAAEALNKALLKNPWLWNVDNRRESYPGSAHAEARSIILRYCVIRADDPTLDEILNEVECVDYPLLNVLPEAAVMLHLVRVMLAMAGRGVNIGRAMITRLPPGCTIKTHIDEGKAAEVYSRYHLPLSTNPEAYFFCGDSMIVMGDGELWRFNHRRPHSVINTGKTDRIHLIVDAM